MEMEIHIKIGKIIIKKYSDYAEKNTLDDECEYFPTLTIIIDGVVESFDGSTQNKESIKKDLVDFAKQLYVDSWLQNAKEDQEEQDIEETNDAIKTFNKLYFKKMHSKKK